MNKKLQQQVTIMKSLNEKPESTAYWNLAATISNIEPDITITTLSI